MVKIARVETERRIDQCYDLHVNLGMTLDQVALQIGIHRSSVARYVRIKRERLEWPNKDRERLAAEIKGFVDKRTRAYWGLFSDKGISSKDRLHALDSLRNEAYQLIRLAEKIGIFPMNQNGVQFNSGGSQQVVFQQVNVNEIISKFADEKIKEKKARVLEDGSGK